MRRGLAAATGSPARIALIPPYFFHSHHTPPDRLIVIGLKLLLGYVANDINMCLDKMPLPYYSFFLNYLVSF